MCNLQLSKPFPRSVLCQLSRRRGITANEVTGYLPPRQGTVLLLFFRNELILFTFSAPFASFLQLELERILAST